MATEYNLLYAIGVRRTLSLTFPKVSGRLSRQSAFSQAPDQNGVYLLSACDLALGISPRRYRTCGRTRRSLRLRIICADCLLSTGLTWPSRPVRAERFHDRGGFRGVDLSSILKPSSYPLWVGSIRKWARKCRAFTWTLGTGPRMTKVNGIRLTREFTSLFYFLHA